MERRCETCEHWRPYRHGSWDGQCTALIPFWLGTFRRDGDNNTLSTQGDYCDSWEAKGEREVE